MIGKRLGELREKSGLTQKELSSRLGMARTTYSGYENGAREPDHLTLQRFADYFDVSVDYLVGRKPKEEIHKEETQLDKDKKYALELFNKITDPDKKKAALEVLKGLAGEK